jgi:thiol-disulfide isomerase/thioredoxin
MTDTIKEKDIGNLVEFYGTECHFCIKMAPMLERLEKEENVKITKVEVWHNSENAALLQKFDKGLCGGVPFFVNRKTGKWICGYADYEKLKAWALGK